MRLLILLAAASGISWAAPQGFLDTVEAIHAIVNAAVDAQDKCLDAETFREEITQGDTEKVKTFWNGLGLNRYIDSWFEEHGTQGWANKIVGSSLHCDNFPSTACGSPGPHSCSGYEDQEDYYLHLSLFNLYTNLAKWHSDLEGKVIEALTGKIDDLVDHWGTLESSSDDFFDHIVGVLGIGAGFTGKELAPVLGPAVSILGQALAMSKVDAVDDSAELEKNLRQSLGTSFTIIRGSLNKTVNGVLMGDEDFDINPAEVFRDGKFVDSGVVNNAFRGWVTGSLELLEKDLLVEIWRTAKGTVQANQDQIRYSLTARALTETQCSNLPGPSIWEKMDPPSNRNPDHGHCFKFGKLFHRSGRNNKPKRDFFEEEDIEQAKKTLGGDEGLKEALKNAYDCHRSGGGEPDWTIPDVSDLEAGLPMYPKCFFNLAVFGSPYD